MAGLLTPKMPKQVVPTVVPMSDPAAIQAAKRKTLLKQSQTGGRASTILSQGDTLGGS